MSVVLHVPHASTVIPVDVRVGILLDDDALARELLASTDHHTDTFVTGLARDDARVRLHVNDRVGWSEQVSRRACAGSTSTCAAAEVEADVRRSLHRRLAIPTGETAP
jgi:hypothetical protein